MGVLPRILVLVAVAGLLAGLLLSIVAGAVSRWPPDRPSGNTALVLPLTSGPMLLSGGWVLAGLALKGYRRVVPGVLFASLGAGVLALAEVYLPLLMARANSDLPVSVGVRAVLFPLLALALGLAIAARYSTLTRPTVMASSVCTALLCGLSLGLSGLEPLVGTTGLPLVLALPVLLAPTGESHRARLPSIGLGTVLLLWPVALAIGFIALPGLVHRLTDASQPGA